MYQIITVIIGIGLVSLLVCYLLRSRPIYWAIAVDSMVVIGLIGINALFGNVLGISLSSTNIASIFLGEGFLCVFIFGLLLIREPRRPIFRPNGFLPFKRYLREIMFVVMFLILIFLLPSTLKNELKIGFSEFYIQEQDYQQSTWRRIHPASEPIPVIVVVKSNEMESALYYLDVLMYDSLITRVDLGNIDPGDIIHQDLILPPSTLPISHYDILLYKDNISTTYRHLSLWIRRQ